MEILRQCENPPHVIYVAVGGGGLISGISAYIKSIWPQVEIIGVEPEDCCAMTKSLKANKIIELDDLGLFADGVAVKKVGKNTFSLTKKYVDSMITVNTDEICAAIKDVFEDTRSILEPAGALAIAGLKADILNRKLRNKNLIAIACGANMNFERLRFVAERAELGEEKEIMLAIEIPEQAGSLIKICKLLGKKNLTEFSYRMSEGKLAYIFMGVEVNNLEDKVNLIQKFKNTGIKCLDMSNNELSKVHLRHMVGGRLPVSSSHLDNNSVKELLYRFEFPERPGALMSFLTKMRPEWTISIFHYRNHGADIGRIVIGVLVEKDDINQWKNFIKDLEYKSFNETNNPAYQLFLGAQN